jgi:protein-S-isoprenylcysteine O-methyltransferase Ste14
MDSPITQSATPRASAVLQVVLMIVVGTFFFFDIIGVFGLPLAIAGLIVAVLGSILVYRRSRTAGDEP